LFLEAGGNFIDTSINYTNGSSETILGDLIGSKRDSLVIATKYTLSRQWDDPNGGGNSRKNMAISLDTSLKRLKTDYIDLYWLHMWDYMTPIEEVMRALDDMVRAGKVLYVGVSDTPAWVVSRANMLAELRGWSPFVALQIPYSLADRAVERELLPMAKSLELAITPWGLLEAGILTGKYRSASTEPKREEGAQISERVQRIVDMVCTIAEEVGRSPAQVAINWIRQRPYGIMIPILGARTAVQLKDNLAVLEWELTPEQVQRLDEISKIDLGFPHGFLDGNQYIFGKMFDKIDNHRR
jgi:aryl-alcohol dehydrogenase-like predicted oxidoreductase